MHAPPAGRRHDALLLDFGSVCLLNPVELHDLAEQRLGLEPGTLDWFGPIAPDTDPLWREMVAGVGLTEREYWAQRAADVGAAAGRELSLHGYMTMLYDPPGPHIIRPEATDVVRRALAAGYGVSVLTNDMRAFHGPDWEHGVEFFDHIDHIVDCSDTGVLKPDPRAFERAVDIIGIAADRMLFVDDQPLNVEGAGAFGLDAVWFDIANATAAWASIAATLGLDPQ
jgi:putative hydrolase of the HAD superfamily